MVIVNGVLTAEVKAEIENLVKIASEKENELGCMLTSHRYAVKNNFVYDNKKGFRQIVVTRYIHDYGSGIVTVRDLIDDCPMYDKIDIQKAGFTPVSEKDIAKYGKIIKFVIDCKSIRRVYNAE